MAAKLSTTVEATLARLASEAHGVVTRKELLHAGVTRHEIQHRIRTGALIAVHRGVYRVGHWASSIEARYMAAVKAGGEGAMLCGRAAAYVLGLVKGKPPPPEIAIPTDRRIKGVITRRVVQEAPAFCRGIPVTSVPRTLVDLAAHLPEEELARACHEAGVRHGTTPKQVKAVLARRPNAKGAATLRAIMTGEVKVTLSKLEERFLYLLKEIRRPLPETNRPAGSKRVDCRWPAHRLTVELDSYTHHSSRHAWEYDRRREREAHARGDDIRRYTWGDVFEHPGAMLAELRALLPEVG